MMVGIDRMIGKTMSDGERMMIATRMISTAAKKIPSPNNAAFT